MSFLPHSSRGRHAVDEQAADDERINGERIAGEEPDTVAPGDEPMPPAGGQTPERPRYAFGYAPDDAGQDDDTGGNVVRGTVVHEDGVPGSHDLAPTAAMPAAPAPAGEMPAAEGMPAAEEGPAVDENWPGEPSFTPVPAPRTATEREQAMQATVSQPAATTAADLGEPLLGDATGLRARWQRAQSDFVDDPRAAVTDAAALVEQTARTMIDALEQRQRLLRQQWEGGQAGDPNAPAGEPADTERLRLTMQRYRELFDQLCV